MATHGCAQTPAVRSLDEKALREYTGTYQWYGDGFVDLQLWGELTANNQLVAIDESGAVRALFPAARDSFFAGPGAGLSNAVESTIDFRRDSARVIIGLVWRRGEAQPREARRMEVEKREDVRFTNGAIQLAGTLISPTSAVKHPAIILVHASGAEDREYLLPFAHFLVRHGIALLGYDKRGVGGSTGNWRAASFEDLAGDVVAAVDYLKQRSDVDPTQIGLLGWSQAGWIMPIAAVRTNDIAFLISVSGAGVPVEETTIDQTRNELTARGMKAENVDRIVDLMKLQYQYARTGERWNEYAAARKQLEARLGSAPPQYPATQSDSTWGFIRRQFIYDPGPVLRRLQTPTLALFGALDNNIIAEKNRAAWESALKTAGNRDYTLRILPNANHLMLEAKTGSIMEMTSLRRFVPEYSMVLREWLAAHVRGYTTASVQPRSGPAVEFSKSSDSLERRDQAVTEEDLRILQRADAILSSAAVWNRHDTRVCKPTDTTWSLFCAMEKASLDVLGEYRHRQVALQEVRFAVEDATKGVELEHRMMDYNNMPTTRFEDIKSILRVATQRVSAKLASGENRK